MNITELIEEPRCQMTIALEGPDRVGKQTQTNMLGSRLYRERMFRRIGLIETPIKDTKTHTHTRIYEMLRDGRAKKYPSAFQGLQIMNRVLYQEVGLKKFLREYDAFVFDRWNASSYAYGYAAGLDHDEIECVLDIVADVDLTIVLDGDPFPKAELDDYESDLEFQRRVRDGYIRWAKTRKKGTRVYIVDANDTKEAVHEAIFDIVCDWYNGAFSTDNVIDLMPYIDARKVQENLHDEI